jgi:uncharacterized protein (DUF2267 family)
MHYQEFISAVAERAGVPIDRAEALTRATLETLAERVTGGEAGNLASQLPKDLQAALAPSDQAAERFDQREFVQRVGRRAGASDLEADAGVRAVFKTLREAVTGREYQHLLAQLPSKYSRIAAP